MRCLTRYLTKIILLALISLMPSLAQDLNSIVSHFKKLDKLAKCKGNELDFQCHIPKITLSLKDPKVTLKDINTNAKISKENISSQMRALITYNFKDAKFSKEEILALPSEITHNQIISKMPNQIIQNQSEIILKSKDKSQLLIKANYSFKSKDKNSNDLAQIYTKLLGANLVNLDDLSATFKNLASQIYIKDLQISLDSRTLHQIIFNRTKKNIENLDYQTYAMTIMLALNLAKTTIQTQYNFSPNLVNKTNKLFGNITKLLLGEKQKVGIKMRFKNDSYIAFSTIEKMIESSNLAGFLELFEIEFI